MDSLHHVLTAVEELRLRDRNISRESHRQILHHNTIRAREESKDILNEEAFIVS